MCNEDMSRKSCSSSSKLLFLFLYCGDFIKNFKECLPIRSCVWVKNDTACKYSTKSLSYSYFTKP